MKENYNDLSKEELIEKLKSKDEQITEMSYKMDCMKADTTKEIEKIQNMREEAFAKLRQENEEYKKLYYNSDLLELKAKNDLLKDTIVAMATYTYPGIANFDKLFKDINRNLEMIREGR